jgi:ribose transport system substrate-binding protein
VNEWVKLLSSFGLNISNELKKWEENVMNKKKIFILCIFIIILIVFTTTSSSAQEEELTFMMISANIADPFHAIIAMAAERTCDELGVNFILKDTNRDLTTQLNLIDSAITMGVDGVAINAVDQKGVIVGIKALNNAGIPVVGFDTIAEGGEMIGAIGIDNYEVARIGAEVMGQLLEEKYQGNIPEDGVILNIQGLMSILIAQERNDGFVDYIEEHYPQLTIASAQGNFNPTDANTVTTDLLTRYGDRVIAINLCTGVMTDGVASAVEASGYSLKDIIFVSNGNFPVETQLIDEGKLDCSVVIPCSPQGEVSMKILYWYVKGMTEKIPVAGTQLIEEGAAWSPANVVEGDVGPVVQTDTSLLCPQDVPTTHPLLLANEIIEWEKQQQK